MVPQNFIESRREQGFLLPPDVREWLAADHLAWFVIDAVAEMDLSAFYAAYRADGHGRAAYEPSVMVALILYAFATGVRSSRAIERHCRQDVAYRVITGNLVPDHATIARFICRHEQALAGLFAEVLKLCDRAGLVKPGVVSIDGTRIAGNASPEVNSQFEQIAREIVAEVRATDEAEDEEFGEARGDELPEQLRTPEGRREFFRQAREQMRREQETPRAGRRARAGGEPRRCRLSSTRTRSSGAGAGARCVAAGGQAPARAASLGEPGSDLSLARRSGCCWRPSGWRPISMSSAAPTRRMSTTARPRADAATVGGSAARAEPYQPPEVPAGKVNVTDPDSRPIPIGFGFVQGYNAQTAVNEQQIVLAAEITNISTDFSQLDPMVTATLGELERAGIEQLPEAVAADAGYWNEQHMDEVVANKHIPVLVAPDKGSRGTPKRWLTSGRATWMRTVLASEDGQRAIPKTQTDSRAAVRRHQTQQRLLPLPPARQDQGAHRVPVTDDDPQPHQGPPPPTRHHGGLKRPPRRHTAAHGGRAPDDMHPPSTARATARAFERQPPSAAGVWGSTMADAASAGQRAATPFRHVGSRAARVHPIAT